METHAHHLHKAPGKNFGHYFFEFLMLFLAVFCGFLAENQREKLSEHRWEKEFMQSIVEDLQTDTAKLNDEILLGKIVRDRLQRLVTFLNQENIKDSIEKLYNLNIMANKVVSVSFEDRTSSQLKNAGNMRLIRNKRVTDSLRNYWGTIKVLDNISSRLEDVRARATDIGIQLFHNKYFKFSDPLHPLHSETIVLPGAKLINNSPELLAEYANRRQAVLTVLSNYIDYMIMARTESSGLIEIIKKEYHLE